MERSPIKMCNDCFIFAVVVLVHFFVNFWERGEMKGNTRKISTFGHFENNSKEECCILTFDKAVNQGFLEQDVPDVQAKWLPENKWCVSVSKTRESRTRRTRWHYKIIYTRVSTSDSESVTESRSASGATTKSEQKPPWAPSRGGSVPRWAPGWEPFVKEAKT